MDRPILDFTQRREGAKPQFFLGHQGGVRTENEKIITFVDWRGRGA
jgi:hypothetical protein